MNLIQKLKKALDMSQSDSKITLNGKTYIGNNIVISGNQVIIDGKPVEDDSKVINITVTGNLGSLQCDNANEIKIEGDVLQGVKTTNGDVDISGEVKGNVSTTNGDVFCGFIAGDVTTKNGDINYTKPQYEK